MASFSISLNHAPLLSPWKLYKKKTSTITTIITQHTYLYFNTHVIHTHSDF
jgi:hypothetical protein